MSIKITSGASLQRMQNAIVQWNKVLDHNVEPVIKDACQRIMGVMREIHRQAIEKNEKVEAIKNAT